MERVDIVIQRTGLGSDPVLVVTGDVDLSTAPQLRKAILDLLAAQPLQRVRINLAGVPLLDSTGVFVLVDAFKRAKERGIPLTVEQPQHVVRRVLEVCGLLEILTAD